MTHKELVEIAYKWILKNGGMTVAFKELYSLAVEIPDVIGFNSWESSVIECKASRSDFLSDKKKKHRLKGMGNWRYYCCPDSMIKPDELPEKWGLIYVKDGKARIRVDCTKNKIRKECESDWEKERHTEGFYYQTLRADENKFEADVFEERRLMFTVIRRLFIKGYVKHIYDKQYNRNGTMNDIILLNSEQKPEECDATGEVQSGEAGKQK